MQVTGVVTRVPEIIKIGQSPFVSEKIILRLVVDRPSSKIDLLDFYHLSFTDDESLKFAKRCNRGDTLTVDCDLTLDNGATKHANVIRILKIEAV